MASVQQGGVVHHPGGIGKQTLVNLNVREVFETNTVDSTKEISRRVNFEIDRKREELRVLVGERYRDLIDAADTIQTMRASSVSVFDKLTSLRDQLSSLPTQLGALKPKERDADANADGNSNAGANLRLSLDELEISAELKLCLEAPRQIQFLVDKGETIGAAHLVLFYDKNLCQRSKPYKWTFLSYSGGNSEENSVNLRNSVLQSCEEYFDDFGSSFQRLAESMVVKQVLDQATCQTVLQEFLERRVARLEENLMSKNPHFLVNVAETIQVVYQVFIDPQLYNTAAKSMKKPKITQDNFGLTYFPKSVASFNNQSITVEDPLRVSVLTDVIRSSFVEPMKVVLRSCYVQEAFLKQEESFEDMNNFRSTAIETLHKKTDDLMKIVLGASKSVWSEIFYPVFLEKSCRVSATWVAKIMGFLEHDAFPRFLRLEEQFDLTSFVWKPPTLNEKLSEYLDVDLKLKCLSPHIAGICGELETQLEELLKDFQFLGDQSVKEDISNCMLQAFEQFVDRSSVSKSLFLGRFCKAVVELCPALWKVFDKSDSIKLKERLSCTTEDCWTYWSGQLSEKFSTALQSKMTNLQPFTIANFMPVAEAFVPPGEDNVKPSIQLPLQLSNQLYSLLFGTSVDLARVGPQSIPKSVRESLRSTIGLTVQSTYESLIENSKDLLTPQVAIQLMFDLKFCQWFQSNLSDQLEPTLPKLQSVIDPFDLDIVSPRLKINLKRFLFETHLTLGLLFSEENQSFIAQNFKTKQNQSFPTSNPALSTPLPLLPV